MRAVHLSAGSGPPADWLDRNRLRVCAPCRDLAPAVGRCTGARCTVTTLASVASGNSPVTASLTTPLDARRPSGLDIVALLGAAGPVRRRVPLGCATLVARSLAFVLAAFLREQSWESLARLLLLPRVCLAAPGRGGKRAVASVQLCWAGCMSVVQDPLEVLLALVRGDSPPEGACTRSRSKAAQGHGVGGGVDDVTQEAARNLLGEGAPARAQQLLSSERIHDSGDPEVFAKRQALHPQDIQYHAPAAEHARPLPRAWSEDQVLSMEAPVRSCPPGGSAGPAGLRPQHFLDCLDWRLC